MNWKNYLGNGVLTVLVATAACGGSSASAPSSADQYIGDQINDECTKLFSCESQYDPSMHSNEPFATYAGGSDVAGCVATGTAFLDPGGDSVDASVAAGRVAFNAADAETCLGAFDSDETCDDILQQGSDDTSTLPAACGSALVGQVAIGGECTTIFDCAAGGDCSFMVDGSGDPVGPGSCAAE